MVTVHRYYSAKSESLSMRFCECFGRQIACSLCNLCDIVAVNTIGVNSNNINKIYKVLTDAVVEYKL